MPENLRADIKLAPAEQSFDEKIFGRFEDELSREEQEYFRANVLPDLQKRPKPEEFSGIVDDLARRKDGKDLLDKQNRADKNAGYLRAKIVEQKLTERIIAEEWLGAGVKGVVTSECDDWLRGADRVLEYDFPKELRIIVDFTSESDLQTLAKEKLNPIFQGIENGALSEVKYFRSSDEKAGKFQLKFAPKLLICFDFKTASKLINPAEKTAKDDWEKVICLLEIKQQIKKFLEHNQNPRRAGYRIDTAGSIAKVYERLREKTEQTYRSVLKNFAERALKTKMPQGIPGALVEKLEPLLIAEVSRRDRSAAALLKLLS